MRRCLHLVVQLLSMLALLVLVLLATYVSLGRYYMPRLAGELPVVQSTLRNALPFPVQVDAVRGGWSQLSPVVTLQGVSLQPAVSAGQQLDVRLKRLVLEIDVLSTLWQRELQLRAVNVQGATVDLTGDWPASGTAETATALPSAADRRRLVAQLLGLGQVRLKNMALTVVLPDGETRAAAVDLSLERRGHFRRLRGTLRLEETGGRVSVLLEARNDPRTLDVFAADGYLRWQNVALSTWGQDGWPADWQPVSMPPLSGKLWLDWQPERRVRLTGTVTAPAATWRWAGHAVALEALSLTLRGQRAADTGWRLDVIPPRDTETIWPFQRLVIQRATEAAPLRLWTDSLDLAGAVRWVRRGLPAEHGLRQALDTLKPAGALQRASVHWGRNDAGEWDWQLTGRLVNGRVDSWRGAPGGRGLAGYVQASAREGFVDVEAEPLQLRFPGVYRQPMTFRRVQGRVGWRVTDERVYVSSGRLDIAPDADSRGHGLLSLNLPLRREFPDPPMMSLVIGLENAVAADRQRYIPAPLNDGLEAWLADSIQKGRVPRAGFVYHGSLRAGARPAVQLFVDVEDGRLDYRPPWPALREVAGTVYVNDGRVDVWATGARWYEYSRVSQAWVRTRRNSDGAMELHVDGRVRGEAADGLRLVRESPVREFVGAALDGWRAEGPLSGTLALRVPLSGEGSPRVDVTATLKDTALRIMPADLTVSDLEGDLRFHSDTGLTSDGFRGRLWDEPVTGAVTTDTADGDTVTDITVRGALPFVAVRDWLAMPWLDFVSGRSDYTARVRIPREGTPVLSVNSDLAGLAVDLPAPLAKPAEAVRPATLTLPLSSGPRRLSLTVDDDMRLGVWLGREKTAVDIGLGETRLEDEPLDGVTVRGMLATLDWADWRPWVERWQGARGDAGPGADTAVRVRDLRVGTLRAYGITVPSVRLGLEREPHYWALQLAAERLEGVIRLPRADSERELELALARLYWPLVDAPATGGDATEGGPARRVPPDWSAWPAMTVQVDDLRMAGERWGQWHVRVRPSEDRLVLRDVYGRMPGLAISPALPARFVWVNHGETVRSEIHTVADLENVENLLDRLGLAPSLRAKKGTLRLDLAWPDHPWAVDSLIVEGTIGFEMRDGVLLREASASTGLLKVLGVLNVNEILRRVRLDFKDLYEEGLAFTQSTGELTLDNGTATLTRDWVIQGPSSKLVLTGQTDLVRHETRNTLTVTLPVASTLPWVAALAGGLPAAAGVYVVSKVLEKQVGKLSSVVYEISGPLDDPDVRFQRLFDLQSDTATKVPAAANEGKAAGKNGEVSP